MSGGDCNGWVIPDPLVDFIQLNGSVYRRHRFIDPHRRSLEVMIDQETEPSSDYINELIKYLGWRNIHQNMELLTEVGNARIQRQTI
jgi:hypothetical protein